MRHGIEQVPVQRTFLLLDAPAACILGQLDQTRDAAHHRMAQQEQAQQQQDCHVQRDVDRPRGRPVEGQNRLVVARQQSQQGCQDKQDQQPE